MVKDLFYKGGNISMDSFFLDFNKEGYVNGVSLNYLGTGYDEGVEPDDAPNYDKILYGNTRLLRNVLLFTKKDEFDILGTNSNQGDRKSVV